MADPRVERLADVLVNYSTSVEPGQLVLLETTPLSAPLLRELYRRVLDAGGHPQTRLGFDGAAEAQLADGSDDQIEWVNPMRVEDFERTDVRISVEASWNTRELTGIDPARQAKFSRARERLRERYLERSRLGERLEKLSGWLGERREIRVVAEGTDLTLGVEGRTWIPCDGKENFPDGEVFTGPVETSVEGQISFSYPASFGGRRVRGIELRFEGGEAVEAHADEGEDFMKEMLAMDDGARRVGEFAFGMNDEIQEFTAHTLYDEKIGGTVHLALGMSYPESGGLNQSALHWDLVCDLRSGSEVYADGELVYRDGEFLSDLS